MIVLRLFSLKQSLFRDATVPRPEIRVGFIPGGSTDSVSDPVMVVAIVIMMTMIQMVVILMVVILGGDPDA